MARGTRERFAKYAIIGHYAKDAERANRGDPLSANEAAARDALDLQPCGVCGRLLGLHSDAQVFECYKRGTTPRDTK